jgi:hypothetical protein
MTHCAFSTQHMLEATVELVAASVLKVRACFQYQFIARGYIRVSLFSLMTLYFPDLRCNNDLTRCHERPF